MAETIFFNKLIERILKEKVCSVEKVLKLRRELCREHKPKVFPSIIQILLHANEEDFPKLKFLQTKPTRTISGVAPIAVMTKPIKCPHGKCIMCPGGPNSVFGDMPQSYTGNEPATMRGLRANFDPYLQVFNRLEQYTLLNQNFDKAELIIMGGTFPSFPKNYQESFVKYCFKALNDYGKTFYKNDSFDFLKFKKFFELPSDVKNEERMKRVQKKILKLKGKCDLKKEQRKNETSKARCVALCQESRPDYCGKKEINQMLKLGTTRVEVGIQTLNDQILKKIERGHTVKESIEATQLMKDSLLKVGYHYMIGLPGSTPESDKEIFKEMFTNPNFKPDALKIYPCMVVQGTKLYKLWKKGKYEPLNTEEAAEIIAESKKFIPKYCRVLRIQRDIPTKEIAAGVDRTNLRQYVHKKMRQKGLKCNCIRCREPKNKKISWESVKILKQFYEASGRTEIFISAEDTKNDLVLGFCRLRIPHKPFRPEITKHSAGIRELHVYGSATPIGKEGMIQHKGIGTTLLKEAEKIAKEKFNSKKMLVISGIGTRNYYKKLNYKLEGAYMTKKLF